MGNLAEALTDMLVAAEDDFGYPAHDPEWLEIGRSRVCTVCGKVGFNEEPPVSPGRRLPTGVIFRGGPALDAEAEEFYRMEKMS